MTFFSLRIYISDNFNDRKLPATAIKGGFFVLTTRRTHAVLPRAPDAHVLHAREIPQIYTHTL